jgi:hypothetical protein
MNLKTLLFIFNFLVSVTYFACSCTDSEEFNLAHYDLNKHIFEVKIMSKYKYIKDTVKSDKPKLPSLYDIGLLEGYNISIIEVFKGDLKVTEKVMGFSTNSSCSWKPEIGNTYIFYTNGLDDVEMCNRIIIKNYDEEFFLKEKTILNSLKKKPNLLKVDFNNKRIIEGNYIKGKRNGIWKIYSTDNKTLFKLKFENDKLLSLEKGEGFKEEDEFHLVSHYLYSELLLKEKE